MPGLILFRRRWAIASDDFVFSSLGEALLRLAWLAVLVIIYAVHNDDFTCAHGSELRAFYIGALVLDIFAIIILFGVLNISAKGTITDSRPRRNISKWLYMRFVLVLPEIIWICISSYWAFGHSYTCDWTVVLTVRGAVICSWIVSYIMCVGILIIFDPMGSLKQRKAISCSIGQGREPEISMGKLTSNKVWETRCRILCCCIACNPDTRQAFIDVSNVVAEFFHDVDLVPSDVAAGLMLVQEQQRYTDSRLHSVMSPDCPDTFSQLPATEDHIPEPKYWMTLPNMVHYMKFAMSSYGWPFFIYENLLTGICKLCPHCRFCACIRKPNGVVSDNICHCNTAVIRALSGTTIDDLIYVTFHNKFKQVPFYVAVDRVSHSVVISIRGTLSFQDALADLSATGANLPIPEVSDSYCHGAMLDCANYIMSELQSLRVLDTAFAQLEGEARLVITGHSLGGGVAAILAVLLKPKYPELICFSFSPPGGLMSPNASKYAQDFVCSVVVGKDLVPRLGMYTLVDMKVKILRAICQSRDPKFKILASGCLRLFCCVGSFNNPTNKTSIRDDLDLRPRDEERISVLQGSSLQATLRAAENQLEETRRSAWPLHPAGQILHILEINETISCCAGQPQYGAFWSRPEDFDKIIISHKMVSDHIPNTVYQALEQLCNKSYVPQFRHRVQPHSLDVQPRC